MYSLPQLALKYLKFYFTASNSKGHGTHSPFIFQFITQVLNDRKIYPEYEKVEKLRDQLSKDQTLIKVEDYGAGSVFSKESDERSISSIVRNAAKPKKFGQLMFRIVRNYQPQTILELGTSLGISTSYLSLANPNAKLITCEGAPNIADVAMRNFETLKLKNIHLVKGNFDDTLPGLLSNAGTIDLAFIDGNHRYEPTLRYFTQILEKSNSDSIIILDDIHWSKEMEEAWKNISNHPSVKCTVDLFYIGIVFFRKEFREKQHFSIRF